MAPKMMQDLTEDGRQLVEALAHRHGFSSDAVSTVLGALAAGGGSQAQFSHPELGGMGQWSQGGMIMIGDMFNQGLKYRVDALCNDLASSLHAASPFAPSPPAQQSQNQGPPSGGAAVSLFVPGGSGGQWPADLGMAASTGSQNDLHYAVFPETHRLAIRQGGQITVYDTGDHWISGFSQQQSGDQSLTFTSQHGLVRLSDLQIVPDHAKPASQRSEAPATPAPQEAILGMDAQAGSPPPFFAPPTPANMDAAPILSDDILFSRLERLAELRKKDVITAEEFDAKKAELLARL